MNTFKTMVLELFVSMVAMIGGAAPIPLGSTSTSTSTLALDTRTGARTVRAEEPVTFSTRWGTSDSGLCAVTVIDPSGVTNTLTNVTASAEGVVDWRLFEGEFRPGVYTLTHSDGSNTLTAEFNNTNLLWKVRMNGVGYGFDVADGQVVLREISVASPAGNVIIPETLAGYPVVSIMAGALAGGAESLSLTVPNNASGIVQGGMASNIVVTGRIPAVSLTNRVFTIDGATMGDGTNATLTLTTVGNGRLVFRWKVSSETDCDFASYALDGTEQKSQSGYERDWERVTNVVTDGGTHVWTFSYAKDESDFGGEDKAWFADFDWQEAGVSLTVNNGTGGGDYTAGDTVTITAENRLPDYRFLCWKGDTNCVANAASATTTVTMPRRSIALTAVYLAQDWLVTVTNGTGGGTYHVGDAVRVVADNREPTYRFAGWTGDAGLLDDMTSATSSFVMPERDVAFTATYRLILYGIAVTNGMGSGVAYTNAEVVTITADEHQGQVFWKWTGDTNTVADVYAVTTTVQVVATNYALTAVYRVPVTVVHGTGSGLYTEGDQLSITADQPVAGSFFDHWEPADGLADATARETALTVPATSWIVTAVYSQDASAMNNLARFLRQIDSLCGFADGSWSAAGMTDALSISNGIVVFSGPIMGDGTNVSVSVTTVGNGALSFRWNVSSESGNDPFSYAEDGTVVASRSGKKNTWQYITNTVTDGGTHVWTFTYSKNAAYKSGEDTAWLADVSWQAAGAATSQSPVPVPYAWLDAFNLASGTSGADYEAAATNLGANGVTAWESYVAGVVPTNPGSVFTAEITITNGVKYISWTPDLTNGVGRAYIIYGATNLTDKPVNWVTPTNAATHFYKVEVRMP